MHEDRGTIAAFAHVHLQAFKREVDGNHLIPRAKEQRGRRARATAEIKRQPAIARMAVEKPRRAIGLHLELRKRQGVAGLPITRLHLRHEANVRVTEKSPVSNERMTRLSVDNVGSSTCHLGKCRPPGLFEVRCPQSAKALGTMATRRPPPVAPSQGSRPVAPCALASLVAINMKTATAAAFQSVRPVSDVTALLATNFDSVGKAVRSQALSRPLISREIPRTSLAFDGETELDRFLLFVFRSLGWRAQGDSNPCFRRERDTRSSTVVHRNAAFPLCRISTSLHQSILVQYEIRAYIGQIVGHGGGNHG